MKSFGQVVLEDILVDPHTDFILVDSHGWLDDSSLPKAADNLGITIITVGPWSLEKEKEIEEKLEQVPTDASRNRVLLVGNREQARRWDDELEERWKIIDLQAIDLFPTLDPQLTQHLEVSQVIRLLPKYGKEAIQQQTGIRGSKATATILLKEIYGIDLQDLKSLEGIVEEAIQIHLRGRPPHPAWIEPLSDDMAPLSNYGVDAVEVLSNLDDLVKIIELLVQNDELSSRQWKQTLEKFLAVGARPDGATATESSALAWKGLDPDQIGQEVLKEDWEDLSLSSWRDRSNLLARLSLAEEVKETTQVQKARKIVDEAFLKNLQDYAQLTQLPWIRQPPMVHSVPNFIQANHQDERVALLVLDCLSVPVWFVLRDVLRSRHQLEPQFETSSFAWIPTFTSVSRQAMLTGKRPDQIGDNITSTYGETTGWSSFWEGQDIPGYATNLIKNIDEHLDEVTEAITNPDLRRLALVSNKIDNLVHASTSANLSFDAMISDLVDNWVPNTLVPLLRDLIEEGWVIYIASDHGFHKMRNTLSNPREGVLVQSRGQRARIYSREVFAQNPNIEGIRWDDQGTLPEDMVTVLAPSGTGYGVTGWGHGGAAWDEVLVPFVRYGGQE